MSPSTLVRPDARQTLSRNLTESVAEDLKGEVVYWAAFYEHRLRLGSKAIFHLEGTSLPSSRRSVLTGM